MQVYRSSLVVLGLLGLLAGLAGADELERPGETDSPFPISSWRSWRLGGVAQFVPM